MAGIELTLLIYSYSILKIDAKKQILIKPKNILDGFKHSFSQPRYIINVLMVSVMFSFYLGVLMSSFKGLFVDEIGVSIKYFSLLFLASSLIYILGVFSYRHKTSSTHKVKYNYGPLLILFVAILVYTVISLSISNVSITIYVICYILGFMIPLTTGAAMTNITKGHGSAAAFITFSVAFFMFVWEFARARLSISNYHFILLALWTTFIIVVLLKLLLIVIEKRMDKELKYK